MESSSSAGETGAGFDLGGGAAFFLEKRATVLKVAGLDGVGADLEAPLKLRGFPSISETPREAAAVDAARGAIYELLIRGWVTRKTLPLWPGKKK